MRKESDLATAHEARRIIPIVRDGARNYHVRPSPDGRVLAFDSDRDGERGIYVANQDGSTVKRVSGPGWAAVPTWASPDGSRLGVRARGNRSPPNVWNLWLLSLDSGETQRLTSYRYGQTWGASWFPGGERIALHARDNPRRARPGERRHSRVQIPDSQAARPDSSGITGRETRDLPGSPRWRVAPRSR